MSALKRYIGAASRGHEQTLHVYHVERAIDCALPRLRMRKCMHMRICACDVAELDKPCVGADVHMVLTRNLNAKRLARMVLNPVMAGVSAVLFDYRTDSQSYTQGFPILEGKRFQDVPFCFDMATVIGLYPADADGALVMSPDPNYVMKVRL